MASKKTARKPAAAKAGQGEKDAAERMEPAASEAREGQGAQARRPTKTAATARPPYRPCADALDTASKNASALADADLTELSTAASARPPYRPRAGAALPGSHTVACARLNVRRVPEMREENVAGTLRLGEEVCVLGDAGDGWARVAWEGGEAFVMERYLERKPPSAC